MLADGRLCFVDTNIWLYACIASGDGAKSAQANRLIHRIAPVISTQVINEVCVNLVRKTGMAETRIQALIHSFYEKYPVLELGRSTLTDASRLRERYGFSFWDGLIVASALSAGVTRLYSEDMQNGMIIDNTLSICNPFQLN